MQAIYMYCSHQRTMLPCPNYILEGWCIKRFFNISFSLKSQKPAHTSFSKKLLWCFFLSILDLDSHCVYFYNVGKSTSFVFHIKNNNDDVIFIFKQAILLNGQLLRSTQDDKKLNVHKKWHLTVTNSSHN